MQLIPILFFNSHIRSKMQFFRQISIPFILKTPQILTIKKSKNLILFKTSLMTV